MRAGGVAVKGVVEVAQRDGGTLVDGFLEASGEAVAEIDTDVLTPFIGVAGLVGVGGDDKQTAWQSLTGFTEAAAVAGLDGEEQFAMGRIGECSYSRWNVSGSL